VEVKMMARYIRAVMLAASVLAVWLATTAWAGSLPLDGDGVVKVRSAYPMRETVERLTRDVAGKGIMFFGAVDQAKLAANAGIKLPPSTLLVFGNPALGAQFLTANPAAGLDWPVRLLVTQDATGAVWAFYTDFAWIARRHGITDRDAAFKMASEVAASIASSVAAK
jgi:uncharacterized protein (DUF302 family)